MKFNLKKILLLLLTTLILCCSKDIDIEPNINPKGETTNSLISKEYSAVSYFTEPNNLLRITFTGTTSKELQTLIDDNNSGAIIRIPKKVYNWSEIKLKTKIQLEIEKGTIIKPLNNNVKRIFSIGTSGKESRVTDVSITGIDGKFLVDLSDPSNLNKNMSVIKIGRVTNFKISNFTIKDRRTSLASILLNYIKSDLDNEPWPKDGVIEKINQKGISHTGYGLVQGYSASNILFKNLSCKGGITLRLETDDKTMKDAVKNDGKSFGLKSIYAESIKCTDGLCSLMLSPHFTQNGQITAKKITAIGCAFAVRIEHGFIEVFDANKSFSLTVSGGNSFKKFISDKIPSINDDKKFIGNQYKRANGTQWAIRLSNASIKEPLDTYIKDQIGVLKNGSFTNSTISDVTAIYKSNTAKLKQAFLPFIPCDEWNTKIKRPIDTEMGNGFEYYGPSMGLKFDNTNGSNSNGNYSVTIIGNTTGFPYKPRDLLYTTSKVCNSNAFGAIPTTTSTGL